MTSEGDAGITQVTLGWSLVTQFAPLQDGEDTLVQGLSGH